MGRQQQRPAAKRDYNDFTDLRVGLYCRVSAADPNNPDLRERSTIAQEAVGQQWIKDHGARLIGVYSDEGISASRFSLKARAEFDRLLADVKDCSLDVIWCWEQSRLSRRPSEFHALLDLCRDNGVIWVIKDQAVDPTDYKATLAPSMMSIVDAVSSDQTSERIRRHTEANALAGRPAGRNLYGYRRIYDPITRRLERVEPDVFDGDGTAVEDSPAAVVREIFERIAAGDSLRSIRLDLDDRGIPTSQGPPTTWAQVTVRQIALNPAYIARRVHRGQVLDGVTAIWPALVDDETFWTVQGILNDPARRTSRPARATYLLSHLISCAVCGGKVAGSPSKRQGRYPFGYTCKHRGCVGLRQDVLDAFVEGVIVAWLSDPDVFAALTAVDDSAAATQARADAGRAKVELEEWRRLADRGEISPTGYARAEKGLLARIAEAEKRARDATIPPVLAGRIGPEAEVAWKGAPLEIKRQIIAAVADIRIRPVGRGNWHLRTGDRVEWRWLLGPGAGQAILPPDRPVPANEGQVLAVLAQDGSILQKHLPERIGRSGTAAGRFILRLMERGWMTRVETRTSRGRGGRPTFTLTLTDDGKAAAATLNGDEPD